eukprot:548377-Amphidinium_carterae.2
MMKLTMPVFSARSSVLEGLEASPRSEDSQQQEGNHMIHEMTTLVFVLASKNDSRVDSWSLFFSNSLPVHTSNSVNRHVMMVVELLVTQSAAMADRSCNADDSCVVMAFSMEDSLMPENHPAELDGARPAAILRFRPLWPNAVDGLTILDSNSCAKTRV